VSDKPFLVVSDLHLGAVPSSTERAFRDFLGYAADEAAGLLINGDLFDAWLEYRTVVPRKHVRVLARLAEVVESGLPVYFVGGNHDAVQWAGDVLRHDVGMTMLVDPVIMDLAGRRTLIVHGDGVGEGDRGYTVFRSVLRNRGVIAAVRALHPDLFARIVGRASRTEDKLAKGSPAAGSGPKHRAPYIEAWAREQLLADPSLDLVLAGHAHVPAVVEVSPGRFYVNSGDWITHFSYVVIPARSGSPELRCWPVHEPSPVPQPLSG
jgi:UDP-2,3-diacylglucosamine hydrolase